ncbi:MAG: hypothetical protein ACREP9_02640 [Candidatus Dormibacteraceae bacterium]
MISPGWLLSGLLILIASQLLYAFYHYHCRSFGLILLSTTVGFLLGQLWAALGWPALQLGDANLLPAIGFTLLLQPSVDRLAGRWEQRRSKADPKTAL